MAASNGAAAATDSVQEHLAAATDYVQKHLAAPTDSVQEHLAAATEIPSLLNVTKLSGKAVLPSPAGYDLSIAADMVVPARGKALVPTDLSITIHDGTYARIVPRSGVPLKSSIDVGPGVIHADYRGPIGVILFNQSDDDFAVKPGDRIAQIIVDRLDAARPDGGDDPGAAVAIDGEAKVTLYRSMPFRVLVDASDSRVFLLMNHDDRATCCMCRLRLLSVGPPPSADLRLRYSIKIHPDGLPKFSGSIPCTMFWTGTQADTPANNMSLSDEDAWGSSDSLSVIVRVKTKVAPP